VPALPRHGFGIVTLDGDPASTQTDVPALWLGTAERVCAIVATNHPGVWRMGILSRGGERAVQVINSGFREPPSVSSNNDDAQTRPSSRKFRGNALHCVIYLTVGSRTIGCYLLPAIREQKSLLRPNQVWDGQR